jgi:hypothetical protein
MQLWTDYEGVMIDGAFPLKKLLMPEGRSAFFSTAGPKGEPTVVRLIECHFDEEEILARWRSVEALNHPNFLKFEQFGQTELDGRPVVYAVFEKVDGNLAEVLDQGSLTVKDVAQLASSLVAALEVLHVHGFVHEHIEPRNIFAVSDVVKLRGDCIREAPEGEEGRAAKQRDVHDLATVLLQALTQRDSVEGIKDSATPPPFGEIIRYGLDGRWGLEKIKAALESQPGSKKTATLKTVNAAPAATAVGEPRARSAAAKPSMNTEAQLPLSLVHADGDAGNRQAGDGKAGFAGAAGRTDTWGRRDSWSRKDIEDDDQSFSLRSRWVAVGVVALVLLLCTWIIAHAWNSHRHQATQATVVSQTAVSQGAVSRETGSQGDGQSAQQISTGEARGLVAADFPRASKAASGVSHAGWRVIAFTYNRRVDAEKKASALARTHPQLKPSVFTPSGHGPYLVSIGGVMDRNAAHALARRSRSLGLPRDAYAQNYR